MPKKLSTPDIVILAGGAAALLGSFLPWMEFDFFGFSEDRNAWSSGLLPTYTWVALFGVVVAGLTALRAFTDTDLPDEVLGFTWRQVQQVLAVFAALMALSFLITDKSPADMGIGFFLSLLGAAALVVGVFMPEPAGHPGGAPPQAPPPQAPPQPPPPPPPG